MNTFFEITAEDFQTVAAAHGVELSNDRANSLATLDESTTNRLLNGIDNLVDIDDQTIAVHNEIEILLMEQGVIPEGEHKFILADQVDNEDDEDLDDEELDDFDEFDDDDFDDDEDFDDEE